MRCEYHRHNGPGRCPICQQNLRNRIDEVKKKRWAGVDWGKGDDQSVVTTHFAPLSADKCRAWSEKIREVAVRNLNEALAGKNWTREATDMTAPTQQQLKDPKWWDREAPEGATHVIFGDFRRWLMYDHGIWRFWEGGWWSRPSVKPAGKILTRPAKPEPKEWDGEPDAYMCPAGCGCLWRDNGDDTMSLYGPRSQSCDVCEPLPLNRLVPVKKLRTQAEREREELAGVLTNFFFDDVSETLKPEDIADAVIAAGWRKADS